MEKTMEIDLREMFRVLLKRSWIIVLCAVLLGSAMLAYTITCVTPMYQASVTMYVNNNSAKDSTSVSANDLSVALRLVQTYVSIITSDRVLGRVIEEAGLMMTTAELKGMISAQPEGETEMFRVIVTSPNPQMSADIANVIARIAPEEIAEIIEGSTAKTIDEAKVPTHRASPSRSLNTIIGAFVGAVLATLVIVLAHVLDVRVKSEEDLQKICDLPVLGVIPNLTGDSKKRRR